MAERLPGRAVLPALVAAAAVAMLPNSLLIPAFPEVARGLGRSASEVGLLVTAYTLAYAALTPFAGVVADRVGRKRVIVPALLAFAAGGLVPLVDARWPVVLAGRVLMGAGGAGILTVVFALLGDLAADAGRARAAAAVSGTVAVADAVVPFLGGLLAAVGGWRAPFYAYALAVPAALAVAVAVPEPPPAAPSTLRAYAAGARAALTSPRLLALYAANVLAALAYFGFFVVVPARVASRLGGGPLEAGLLFLAFGVAWTAVAVLLRARAADERLVAGGLALSAGSLVAAAAAPGLVPLAAAMVAWGAGTGLVYTPLFALLAVESPASHRAAAASVFNALTLVGLGLGPAAAAALGGAFVATGLAAAGATLVALAAFAALRRAGA